ncbi:MAG: DNA repair protein RadA [Nitrospinae bacterium RIFCSPLOWO2_12_FULL_45_22]|nr:MAG: DNA repair protein RadA [Nitrospinae bacterium RIFCSPLOWO2_12_FULL_45_22]
MAPKWLGRCPDCGEWNTFVEEKEAPAKAAKEYRRGQTSSRSPVPITQVSGQEEDRLAVGMPEFDRVLGGGIVPGSVVLIGGDPGIGKSTLLLQLSGKITAGSSTILYVTGEESTSQTRLRANRLGALSDNLYLLAETCLEDIIPHIEQLRPAAVIIDSIQTIYTQQLPSTPGSIGQVREVAAELMGLAKGWQIPIFLIGHVTKEGAIAGPKALEHMVDTVLYFEGERGHSFRILRAVKNRFGSTNEIGVFEMGSNGLVEVSNPSEIFLAERPKGASGSIVVSSVEGTRPILVELQALVTPTNLGTPRRMVTGLDYNRVALMIAVLEKRAGFHLFGEDIFLNIAGGVKIEEPAVDLGIALAIASSFRDKPIDNHTVAIGEVGLTSEVRGVPQLELRVREAAKLGFQRAIVPRSNMLKLKDPLPIALVPVTNIKEALEELL